MSTQGFPSTLDIPSASTLMCVHPRTTLDLISQGVLPAGKVGRSYVLLYKDVMAHIERVIVKQTAERMGGVPLAKRASPHRLR